ncbi:hypothetical protein C8J56DRAFT_1042822 [Mycena floridula]|nr:hypothetical protein C8J56DRAFT_1042822 [Mycena floridula]
MNIFALAGDAINPHISLSVLHTQRGLVSATSMVGLYPTGSQWWTDVELWLSSMLLSSLENLKDQTPKLERLRLHAIRDNTYSPNLIECFQKVPALQNITIYNIIKVPLLELPWAHHRVPLSPWR